MAGVNLRETTAMPAFTRWFVKSAFAYFVGAMLPGVAVAMPAVFQLPPVVGAFGSVYFHFATPRTNHGGVKSWAGRHLNGPGRGHKATIWLDFTLPNAGVLMVGIGWMLGALALMPLLRRIAEGRISR